MNGVRTREFALTKDVPLEESREWRKESERIFPTYLTTTSISN